MLNIIERKLEEMDIERKSLEQIVQELEDMFPEMDDDIFLDDYEYFLDEDDLEEEGYIPIQIILEDDELELSERESQWFR
jgi:hypothetical protein